MLFCSPSTLDFEILFGIRQQTETCFPSSSTLVEDQRPYWGVVVVAGRAVSQGAPSACLSSSKCPWPLALNIHPSCLHHKAAVSSQATYVRPGALYLRPRLCLGVTVPATDRVPWKRGCRPLFSSPERHGGRQGRESDGKNRNTLTGTIAHSLADTVNSKKSTFVWRGRVPIHPHREPPVHKAV